MKKSDLKPGYMVVLRNEDKFILMPYEFGISLVSPEISNGEIMYTWQDLDDFDENMKNCVSKEKLKVLHLEESVRKEYDIVQVYGLAKHPGAVFNMNQTKGDLWEFKRELLWERTAPKKMTIAEISEKLGHEVEIVDVKEGEIPSFEKQER